MYISNVLSGCCIYMHVCKRMFQVFEDVHMYVASVHLNVTYACKCFQVFSGVRFLVVEPAHPCSSLQLSMCARIFLNLF
jgi:hypothetical protein